MTERVHLGEENCNQILDFVEEELHKQIHGDFTGAACRIELINEQGVFVSYITCSPLPPISVDPESPDQS